MSANSSSVYFLIGELCEQIFHENNSYSREQCNENFLKKLKSKSYEILLKKTNAYDGNFNNIIDPIRELETKFFTLKIQAHNDCKKIKKYECLKMHLNYVSSCKYFTDGNGKDILILLLLLQDDSEEQDNSEENNLLIPGPFTLHYEFAKSSHYPTNTLKFSNGKPEMFQGLNPLLDYRNPYIAKFMFKPFKRNNAQNNCLIQPKPFNCYENWTSNNENWSENQNAQSNFGLSYTLLHSKTKFFNIILDKESTKATSSSAKSVVIPFEERRFLWEWEHLGYADVKVAKSFTSESNGFYQLQTVLNKSLGKSFVAKIVPLDFFLKDVKSLCVGIQSDSFEHNENIIFNMKRDITVHGISTSSLKNFIEDFLECGTCYKRLQIMIMKRNYKLMFDGFIFKSICTAVEDYLILFRQFVYAYEDKALLSFSKRMRGMMKQLSSLSCTLAIHPNGDANIKPPKGSQFLGYLYKEIMRATQKDIIMLLVFILKKCCHVYFKYLQKWIFYGHLDDPSNELFICFINHYRTFTKYHYDKAYFVRKESVPGFFHGYEDRILLCGKYAMILKAYKPNHPLHDLEYPPISVCLTFNEIEAMEKTCKQYSENASKVCGKAVTIRDIFERKRKAREEFLKLVARKSQTNLQKWLLEKNVYAELKTTVKKNLLNEMHKQMEEAKNRKIEERKENIALERQYLRDLELQNDKELELENRKLLENTERLMKLVDPELNKIESITINLNGAHDLTTPISSDRTDFTSCNDYEDEDAESFYDDCMSPDRIEKIEQENNNEIDVIENCASNDINSNNLKALSEGKLNNNCNEMEMRMTHLNSKPDFLLTKSQQVKLDSMKSVRSLRTSNSIDLTYQSSNKPFKNSSSTSNISDLQKNRNKMMQSNTFAYLNDERPNLNLELNSEFARNRKRVLQCEYDILPSTIAAPADIPTANTPMSTSSDPEPTFDLIEEDKTNGNFNENELKESVIVDSETDTPDIALNTAGILAKNGFEFPTQNSANTNDFDKNEINLNVSTDESSDGNLPYERCKELLISNFKCKPISPYFHFNEYNEENTKKSDETKNKEITNISVYQDLNSTLTEFLQKSITMPLKVHLDILNNEIMRVFLEDLDIIGHFKSLRNYFFLMDGEFGSIISDELISKLENSGAKPNELLNYQMLHSILDKAIGSSILPNDKNSDNLSFIVYDVPENFDLNSPSVLINVSLSYRVEWPLNLVLNPETLEQYAIIFKYLLKVRRISWVLEEIFQMLKQTVKTNGKEMLLSPQYHRIQQIRHKFFHFVHALKNHITSNALQASWKTFKDDLLTAKNLEDIYRKHTNYIKKILFLCMLNKRSNEFNNVIENIFKVTLRFYRNLKSREWKKKSNNEFFTHSRFEKIVADENEFEKFIKYTIYLGNKIVKRGYQEEIGEFINLINYNNYYTRV